MQLNENGLLNERKAWKEAGYQLPLYNREAMVKRTKENPFWLHFGAGNIFRAFQANVVEELLNIGAVDRGLISVGGHEAMEKLFLPHDNYTVLVTLKANGTIQKRVVGSIAESLTMDEGYAEHWERLKEIFQKDSLQMVSFTITEKGYDLHTVKGNYTSAVEMDLKNGPIAPVSYMGKLASLLYTRYLAGEKPVAMVSMDNCSHNGEKLYQTMMTFVENWTKKGLIDSGFENYIQNSKKVAFPWSMIDKITPRPDKMVECILEKDGIKGLTPIITEKKTYIAPFVNAEEAQYLVIEDDFPNGRPELEKGGVIFARRKTVDQVEKMKVCTCLNPLHTALAIFGCLLKYTKISEEMSDPLLKKMVECIGYEEGLPVVKDPKVLDPEEFIRTVLEIRLPNPFMPDTPQRIVTDTSQKLAIRYGETIKAYVSSESFKIADLKCIPLVLAGWLRYLMGVDDMGEPFELSPDPLLDTIRPVVSGIDIEIGEFRKDTLDFILENEKIFGVNLKKIGMAETISNYFGEMIQGKGAVRRTLEKYIIE